MSMDFLSPLEKLGGVVAAEVFNEDLAKKAAQIEASNARKIADNNRLPEAQRKPQEELGLEVAPDPWTTQGYGEQRVKDVHYSWADTHKARLAQKAIEHIATLPAQTQGAIFAKMGLNIPGLLAAGVTQAEIPQYALNKFLAMSRADKDELVAMAYPELA